MANIDTSYIQNFAIKFTIIQSDLLRTRLYELIYSEQNTAAASMLILK